MIDTIEVGELLRQIGVVMTRLDERLTRVETDLITDREARRIVHAGLRDRVMELEAQLAARTGTVTASRWAGDSAPGVITDETPRAEA